MDIKVIASTKSNYFMPIENALEFGGRAAGICYMPDTYEAILNEDIEKTRRRVKRTLESGHHSVYDHTMYSFLFTDIPKILAMVLNNEGFYTTSEKSARYTKMNPSEGEMDLYIKWADIFKGKIREVYPKISSISSEKLALENARYMMSVFTPTTMKYTVSLRQISYIIGMMKSFIKKAEDNKFNSMLKSYMNEFIEASKYFDIPHLNSDFKGRELSIFDTRVNRQNEFGENYSVNYFGSFAQLAQAQRHRTLDYRMGIIEGAPDFYIPPIIRTENNGGDTTLENMWRRDIESIADVFPQGMLIKINERGTYENFILKAKERLCGTAQLEITEQTKEILIEYVLNTHGKNDEVSKELEQYVIKKIDAETGHEVILGVPRCRFPGWKCNSPCIWGVKGLERLI